MKGKARTLVILTPAFPDSGPDSTWVFSQQLMVKTLKEDFPGLEIVVLTFLYPDQPRTYEWNGVKVISFNGMKMRKWRRIFLWIKVWKAVGRIHRTICVRGIVSFWCGECALVGKYLGKRYRIKHLCWICGQDARKSNRYVRLIHPRPEELVAMSGFLASEFNKNHAVKPLYVVPNAIDPGQFSSAEVQRRDIDVLGVGSLEPFKQYSLFVNTVKSMQGHVSDIRAVLCGTGPERDSLEKLANDLGIENSLQFYGLTPHQEVLSLMRRAKVLLHTSNYEGFSTVCLEALYAGAHVVSFCDPMQGDIAHWHIVKTKAEMLDKALELLSSSDTSYTSVLAHTMQESASSFVSLLDGCPIMAKNVSFYNGIAHMYNDTMHSVPANAVIRQKVKEKVIQLVPSGRVMDFGGGTGLDLEWLAPNHTIFFCEPSVKMREQAMVYNREKLHTKDITFLETLQTDFTHWPEVPPFSVKLDGVLCNFGVLNYIPDIKHLFSVLATILKSGAHFMAVVLEFSLKKRLQWHRRNALLSLATGRPFVMYIPGEDKQIVTIHTIREIIKASSPYFERCEYHSLGSNDFTFIHLIRK